MERKNELPEILQDWAASIEATRRACIDIHPRNGSPAPGQSQLGGLPFWPEQMEYPTGVGGAPLYLLVQLNFADLPAMPPFPDHGILQIFVADDPLYGMDYQMPQWQGDFRVVYHADLYGGDVAQLDFSFLPPPEDFPMPWRQTYALDFSLNQLPAPADAPEFTQELGADFFQRFGDEKWAIEAAYRRYAGAAGHKLGGYPHFPQEDPRSGGQPSFLLLQLDSDPQTGLNWGDRGTAHFFLSPQDLLNGDFSRVFYSWSSY